MVFEYLSVENGRTNSAIDREDPVALSYESDREVCFALRFKSEAGRMSSVNSIDIRSKRSSYSKHRAEFSTKLVSFTR